MEFAREFYRDWERLTHSGRYDMNRIKAVMLRVANDAPLPPEWLDHSLRGEWTNYRECHAGGDFLLIYRVAANGNGKGEGETVFFMRAGTHADLFEYVSFARRKLRVTHRASKQPLFVVPAKA